MKNKLWIPALILELAAVCFLVLSMVIGGREGETNWYLPVALGLNCLTLALNFITRKK